MAINYDEINDNLLRVIQNADNQGEFLQHFLGDPAGNVTFKNVAPDGSLITRTIPNLAKFTGDVYSTVGDALNLTVYVDAINGDDANDGSATSPKQTVKAVVESTPNGATVRINHHGDVTIDAALEQVNIADRRVAWIPNDDTPAAKVILKSSSDAAGVLISRGGSIYSASALETQGQDGDIRPIRIIGGGTMIVTSGLQLNGIDLLWCRMGIVRVETTDISATDVSQIMGCGGGVMQLSMSTGATINGDAVTDVLGDWIGGVVYDADSGNPVNVLSNINISK